MIIVVDLRFDMLDGALVPLVRLVVEEALLVQQVPRVEHLRGSGPTNLPRQPI